jgi:predicted aspartyl protease
LRVPAHTATRRLDGKIDSGADICAVPETIIAELDLPPVRTVRAAGFAGVLTEATHFHVELEIAGHRFEHLEVLSTRRPYAIIGRNVLQRFVVRLDGPKALLTMNVSKIHRASRK